jgi:hypothetical protein
MTENPRRKILRRARLATAGIVVTAVAGTAGLTAAASNATAQGGNGGNDGPLGGLLGGRAGHTSGNTSNNRGSGVVQARASNSQPQASTNAS